MDRPALIRITAMRIQCGRMQHALLRIIMCIVGLVWTGLKSTILTAALASIAWTPFAAMMTGNHVFMFMDAFVVAHAGYSFYHTYDIKLRDKFSWAFRSLHGSMATLEAFCIQRRLRG